jgi:hypothetical protein
MGLFFDDDETHAIGKPPSVDSTGQTKGPYAYGNAHPYGVSGGFGVANGPYDPKYGKNVAAGWAGGGAGQWTDTDGNTNYGFNAEGGILKTSRQNLASGGANSDMGVGTFQVGAYHNKNTTSIGGQANAAEASITLGDQGNNVRVGGSMGCGLGLRVHHGDADNDGVPEYGIGFDAGVASFDLKSEILTSLIKSTANPVDIRDLEPTDNGSAPTGGASTNGGNASGTGGSSSGPTMTKDPGFTPSGGASFADDLFSVF